VTADNFLKVLAGEPTSTSGRVLQTGPDDHVFIYYSDHGNRHILGFPWGFPLRADSLKTTLLKMHKEKRYAKMLIYIEACLSGSMFDQLPKDINVFAVTASNPRESSYACYYDHLRRTYLADEFSAHWMEDSWHHGQDETLLAQFNYVRKATKKSHVMSYGDIMGMGGMHIGQFQGSMLRSGTQKPTFVPITDAVPTYDVPYMSLFYQLRDTNSTEERLQLLYEMQAEQTTQLTIRESIEGIVKRMDSDPVLMLQPTTPAIRSKEIDDCYAESIEKYMTECNVFSEFDYAMKDMHVFENLCAQGNSMLSISEAIKNICL